MTPDYNDGNWHGWNGGECPVHPETMVAAIAANGNMMIDTFAPSFIERQASTITWSKDKDAARAAIVAFRVTKPYSEPREGYAVTLFATAREAKTAHPGREPIFVREVTE